MKILRNYWPLLIILAVVGFLFSFRLGRDLLWDWDECLYGQYAKEMLQKGHFLTNIWNGYIDLQKPPLYSWLLQIPSLFGRTEFNLRFLNVAAALGLLTSVYLFTQKFFSRITAVLATLILLTGEIFVIYSMKLSTDMLFSLFLFLGVWTWFSTSKRSKHWLGAGLLFGAASMTKGLSVTPFLAALFLSLFLHFKKEKLFNFLKLALVYVLTLVPWHLITYLEYGQRFVKVYLLDNIIKRSRYPIEFHRERIWFYPVLLFKELLPWLFSFIVFPINVVMSFSRKRESRSGSPLNLGMTLLGSFKKHELIYTLVLLIIVPLLSITRVQTRIAWYALPIYPFLAIFLAYNFTLLVDFLAKKKKWLSQLLLGLLITLITLDAGYLIYKETKLLQDKPNVDARYEVAQQVARQPGSTLHYLVAKGERGAKLILPPEEQIDMTWVYGGNGCMVYYGNKQTTYHYETAKFEQALKNRNGLFLVENGDAKYAESQKILFRNSQYTLFTF